MLRLLRSNPVSYTHLDVYKRQEYNNAEPGATWLRRLTETWPHAIWLNPESEHAWQYRQSTSLVYNLMGGRMFPLTLDGLERGMRLLSK